MTLIDNRCPICRSPFKPESDLWFNGVQMCHRACHNREELKQARAAMREHNRRQLSCRQMGTGYHFPTSEGV